MGNIIKVRARLKHKPEDFIVEEVGEKWECKISDEFIGSQNPDFSNLDVENRQDFLWLEMEKRDIDHFSSLKEISFYISRDIDSVSAAGAKDKRAWTSQRISIFKPDLEKLKFFSHPNITLKNFKWAKRKIKIGYLMGNNFRIVLRDIDKKEAILISNKLRSVKWFPNYFGPQRFGMRNNNDKIGKLIVKRKFKEAIWSILTDIGNESESASEAREKLKKDKDLLSAQGYFPPQLKLENRIIDYLVRNDGDYLGAIIRVDRKSMLMFVNALQSRIFNEILERALDEGLDFTRGGHQNCLLVGYKSRFYEGRLGEIERQVLEENGLCLEDFDVREIGYLRMKGSFRKAVSVVRDLDVELDDDDEFEFSKKISLSFGLSSGVYATTLLDNFFHLD